MLIYKITRIFKNGKRGKIYVGQTINKLNVRINDYKNDVKKLKNGKIKNRPIIAAIAKYGIENFRWEIIEDSISDGKTLDERETYWIKKLDATNRKIGYNVATDGSSPTRGRKLNGEHLVAARQNALIASQKSAELSRGKPQTGAKLLASRENIKKAHLASVRVRSGKSLNKKHKSNISKGLTNNPKVRAASQKPRPKGRINLTDQQIRNVRNDQRTYKIIASEYGISTATISRIKNGKRHFREE